MKTKLSETYKENGIDFAFPIEIKNANGKVTYYESLDGYWLRCEYDANKRTYFENSRGYWRKYEYDANGKETYYEDSNGYWYTYEYDANGNETYSEDSTGYWNKREYDANGNETYYENSDGLKRGTPKSQSCDGKIIEVDFKKYKLTKL